MINKVCVVGLGLIGGSFAKALKTYTPVEVFGYDISKDTVEKAKKNKIIDAELTDKNEIDVFVLALYPNACVEFVKNNLLDIKPNAFVIDMCGVKRFVCDEIDKMDLKATFIGGHPMAGKEMWGIDSADGDLYKDSSMIFVAESVSEEIEELFRAVGFTNIVLTNATQHDKMIAFTSQLAHVISSAYVKIPSAQEHEGYSAGSFKDMTRVAKLNENMWTDLFIMNKDYLVKDIDFVIGQLQEYRDAISEQDSSKLHDLLREGREIKERL